MATDKNIVDELIRAGKLERAKAIIDFRNREYLHYKDQKHISLWTFCYNYYNNTQFLRDEDAFGINAYTLDGETISFFSQKFNHYFAKSIDLNSQEIFNDQAIVDLNIEINKSKHPTEQKLLQYLYILLNNIRNRILFDTLDLDSPELQEKAKNIASTTKTMLINYVSGSKEPLNESDEIHIVYPKKKKDPEKDPKTEVEVHDIKVNFQTDVNGLMDELETRIDNWLNTPAKVIETNPEELVKNLGEVMMIFNNKIARLSPGKHLEDMSLEIISEDWFNLKNTLNIKSISKEIIRELSIILIPKMLDLLIKVAQSKDLKEIIWAVKVALQSSGKGTFAKTNARVMERFALENLDYDLLDFFTKSLNVSLGEIKSGTDGLAVPEDGDINYAYSAVIARQVFGEFIRQGSMVDDEFMVLMTIFELIKQLLLGKSGAEVDTLPRTQGQLRLVEETVKPYLSTANIKLITIYQEYEMANEEDTQFIAEHKEESIVASGIVSSLFGKLSSEAGLKEEFGEDLDMRLSSYLDKAIPNNKIFKTEFQNSQECFEYITKVIKAKKVGDPITTETKELISEIKNMIRPFYSKLADFITEKYLQDEYLDSLVPSGHTQEQNENIKRIIRIKVKGVCKIISERVAGRVVEELREDDQALYSLANRIRSTASTMKDFANVVQEFIPVDGNPQEAWEMFIKARLQAENPELHKKIYTYPDNNHQLVDKWNTCVEIGKNEHFFTVNGYYPDSEG